MFLTLFQGINITSQTILSTCDFDMVSGKLFGKLLALVDVLVGNVEPLGHCLADFLLSLALGCLSEVTLWLLGHFYVEFLLVLNCCCHLKEPEHFFWLWFFFCNLSSLIMQDTPTTFNTRLLGSGFD